MFHKLYKSVMTDICCLCDTYGLPELDLCHACHKSLPHNHNCCHACSSPLAGYPNQSGKLICGRCLSHPSGIDDSVVPYLYRPPVDFMIKRLKFSEELKFSRLLGDLLADAIESRYATDQLKANDSPGFPDVILSVPIHRQRLLQRGFNQAEQIAHTIANRFNRQCDTTSVARLASKQSQTSLSALQREANIRRAFEVRDAQAINGRHIAVVDDVVTTGATARSIARKLKAAGATSVSIWAVARTP